MLNLNFIKEEHILEIDEMYFTVKENVTDKNYVLQKSLENDMTCTDERNRFRRQSFS